MKSELIIQEPEQFFPEEISQDQKSDYHGYIEIDYNNNKSLKFHKTAISQLKSSRDPIDQNIIQSHDRIYTDRLDTGRQSIFYHISKKSSKINFYQAFNRYFIVKRFVQTLRFTYNPQLGRLSFNLIRDYASDYLTFSITQRNNWKDYFIFNKIKNKDKAFNSTFSKGFRALQNQFLLFSSIQTPKCIQAIPLISPQTTFMVCWNILLTLIRILVLIFIPIELGFQIHIMQSEWYQIIWIPLFLFLDIILRFNTIYYEEGIAINQRLQIFIKQINVFTFSDIFILIPFFVPDATLQRISLFFFLLQYRHIKKVFVQWQQSQNFSRNTEHYIELMQLIIQIMYLIHLFACVWYFIGSYQMSIGNDDWVTSQELETKSWSEKYLTSIYFSAVTLFTVGYGDISPKNYLEQIFCIFYMFISSIQFSYTLNTVGGIITELKVAQEDNNKKLRCINKFMRSQGISQKLQYEQDLQYLQCFDRIRAYLTYFWSKSEAANNNKEQELVQQLPNDLKNQLVIEANTHIFKKCKFFCEQFSKNCTDDLLMKFNQVTIAPEIFLNSESLQLKQNETYFAYLQQGSIQIYYLLNDQDEQETAILQNGQYFNLIPFLQNKMAPEHYKTLDFTQLVILGYQDFLSVLEKYPDDFERYQHSKSQFDQVKQHYQKCQACDCKGHDEQNCPTLHFIPDREKIIKKHQYPVLQYRSVQKYRKQHKSLSSIRQKKILTEINEVYQQDQDDIVNIYNYNNENDQIYPINVFPPSEQPASPILQSQYRTLETSKRRKGLSTEYFKIKSQSIAPNLKKSGFLGIDIKQLEMLKEHIDEKKFSSSDEESSDSSQGSKHSYKSKQSITEILNSYTNNQNENLQRLNETQKVYENKYETLRKMKKQRNIPENLTRILQDMELALLMQII